MACGTTPMRALTRAFSFTTSWPMTRAAPAVGFKRVVSILMRVVLPAPLGPRRPKNSPSGTSRLTPPNAVSSPYFLTRSVVSIARILCLVQKYPYADRHAGLQETFLFTGPDLDPEGLYIRPAPCNIPLGSKPAKLAYLDNSSLKGAPSPCRSYDGAAAEPDILNPCLFYIHPRPLVFRGVDRVDCGPRRCELSKLKSLIGDDPGNRRENLSIFELGREHLDLRRPGFATSLRGGYSGFGGPYRNACALQVGLRASCPRARGIQQREI